MAEAKKETVLKKTETKNKSLNVKNSNFRRTLTCRCSFWA